MIGVASRRLLSALAGAVVLAGLATSVRAGPEDRGLVLDLDEAAALLRVEPEILGALADADRVPARRVGDRWRFARDALLEWLKGERFAGMAVIPPSSRETATTQATAAPPIVRTQVADGAGRASSAANPPPTLGERPSTATAEDIALRDQRVLLPRGRLSLDFGVSYTRSEQTVFPVARAEQNTVGANATVRYGVLDDLQVTFRMPAAWRRTAIYTDGTLAPSAGLVSTHDRFAGDPALSLIGVGMREGVGRPNVLWSVDAVVPGAAGDAGIGGGIVISKSYDPAVVFAGLSYLRGLSVDPADARRSLARNNAGFSLGYTYALNDTVALSTLLAGAWRDSRSPDGVAIPPARERYQLQFGMTWLLARGLFMEPAAAVRLGGDRPDLTLSLNLPYTF